MEKYKKKKKSTEPIEVRKAETTTITIAAVTAATVFVGYGSRLLLFFVTATAAPFTAVYISKQRL